MTTPDWTEAHHHFSTSLFNATWVLLDQPDRTADDEAQMLLRAMASYYHWTARADATDRHHSVGAWLIARVQAVLGRAEDARWWAQRSLTAAERGGLSAFYVAYAHEALARAACVRGDAVEASAQLELAHALILQVDDLDERQALVGDLEQVGRWRGPS
jgi:hypothetical protein